MACNITLYHVNSSKACLNKSIPCSPHKLGLEEASTRSTGISTVLHGHPACFQASQYPACSVNPISDDRICVMEQQSVVPLPANSPESALYRTIWGGGPYTSFDMLQHLLNRFAGNGNALAGPSDPQDEISEKLQSFLSQPTIFQQISKPGSNTIANDSANGSPAPLYARRTGLCTSFAMKFIHLLRQSAAAHEYNFAIYDLGRHRLARCERTKIVIDSKRLHRLQAGGWQGVETAKQPDNIQIRRARLDCSNHFKQGMIMISR
jgi:hypothetical protein